MLCCWQPAKPIMSVRCMHASTNADNLEVLLSLNDTPNAACMHSATVVRFQRRHIRGEGLNELHTSMTALHNDEAKLLIHSRDFPASSRFECEA